MNARLPVTPCKKLLAKKFRKTVRTLARKLGDYIDNPEEDSIHDVRVAIRRLEAVHRIMPKGSRKREDLEDYVRQAGKLFKINTQIRDFDIIRAKLEGSGHASFGPMIEGIEKNRRSRLVEGRRLAVKLMGIPPPRLKEGDIREYRLQKRFRKVVLGLAAEIGRNIPLVLSDDRKIEEIHKLRKDFKKLRYSVETAVDDAGSSRFVRSLKKIQDELGLIHDSDIFLDYIRGLEGSRELSELRAREEAGRRVRYRKFVLAVGKEKLGMAWLGL